MQCEYIIWPVGCNNHEDCGTLKHLTPHSAKEFTDDVAMDWDYSKSVRGHLLRNSTRNTIPTAFPNTTVTLDKLSSGQHYLRVNESQPKNDMDAQVVVETLRIATLKAFPRKSSNPELEPGPNRNDSPAAMWARLWECAGGGVGGGGHSKELVFRVNSNQYSLPQD